MSPHEASGCGLKTGSGRWIFELAIGNRQQFRKNDEKVLSSGQVVGFVQESTKPTAPQRLQVLQVPFKNRRGGVSSPGSASILPSKSGPRRRCRRPTMNWSSGSRSECGTGEGERDLDIFRSCRSSEEGFGMSTSMAALPTQTDAVPLVRRKGTGGCHRQEVSAYYPRIMRKGERRK